MKTLPQLLAIRGRTPTAEVYWAHESYFFGGSRGTRVPNGIIKAHNGPYYFVWHEPCYYKINTLYKPARCPATRRPIVLDSKWNAPDIIENYGPHHHRYKKFSSRRVRRALRREDMRELEEYLKENITFEEYLHDRKELQIEKNNFFNMEFI